jgi:hypothetical protein
MRESAAEMNDLAFNRVKPGLAKTIPEWPQIGYMLDSRLFNSFADCIVRLVGFAAQCEPGHPCLTDETRIFKRKEDELRTHLLQFRSAHLWDIAQRIISSYVKRLALERVEEMGFDEELEEAIRKEIVEMNLSRLTTP